MVWDDVEFRYWILRVMLVWLTFYKMSRWFLILPSFEWWRFLPIFNRFLRINNEWNNDNWGYNIYVKNYLSCLYKLFDWKSMELKREIHVIIQSKHFCLHDFSLRIWKLKYTKQYYCQLCYMEVKRGLLH